MLMMMMMRRRRKRRRRMHACMYKVLVVTPYIDPTGEKASV